MKKTLITTSALAVLFMALASLKPAAEKNQLEKIWYNQEKTSKIQIYLAKDGSYYGKIVWLKEPNDKDTGKPRTDKENPDKDKRETPLINLLILRQFKQEADNPNVYSGGTIYDPKNGKTYCGKITFKGTTLDLRGYLCSASFLGRTATWTLAEGQ
ncbi:MAG: DUF2147 domain-containing protein [Chitinophagales bacterium]